MILLFGASGQLGRRLQQVAGQGIAALDMKDCDFATITRNALAKKIAEQKYSLIINAAAWTAVDDAENHFDTALRVNAQLPGWLAELAAEKNIPFYHFSTDYVFDGDRGAPYAEDAKSNPVNRYGESKLQGERMVLAASGTVFRLQWLYDAQGKNFLRSILQAMKSKDYIRVVADQIGAPTAAEDVAKAVLSRAWQPGTYHLAAAGHTSWHGFACAIRDAAGLHTLIEPIVSDEYPLPALRPKDTRLNTAKAADLGITLPHWQTSLKKVMHEIA